MNKTNFSVDLDDVSSFAQSQVARYNQALIENFWNGSNKVIVDLYENLMLYFLEDGEHVLAHRKEAVNHTISHLIGKIVQRERYKELKASDENKEECRQLILPANVLKNARLREQEIQALNAKILKKVTAPSPPPDKSSNKPKS